MAASLIDLQYQINLRYLMKCLPMKLWKRAMVSIPTSLWRDVYSKQNCLCWRLYPPSNVHSFCHKYYFGPDSEYLSLRTPGNKLGNID